MFESIKHIDEYNNEYWLARELQKTLNYKEWRKFENVIDKSKIGCVNANLYLYEHFVDADKTLAMPNNARKIIKDYKLSRYACYLIAIKVI